MRKLTTFLGTLVLLTAAPRMGQALILSHALVNYEASPDVLFDSTIGTLMSVSLEIKFQTSVVYETPYYDRTLGTMHPFDITFFGGAPFSIYNDAGSRFRTFSWSMPGHGEGGSGSPFYWAAGSATSLQTYTAPEVLDFFTFHEGDAGLAFYGWNDWITCTPEKVFDDLFIPYLYYYASTQFGNGVVITYNYEALTPVPEAASSLLLGVGTALAFTSRLHATRRGAGA